MKPTKEIWLSSGLLDKFQDQSILLDTTALIEASKSPAFLELLIGIKNKGCDLFTVPFVVTEFLRPATDIKQYNKFKDLMKSLGLIVLEQKINDDDDFRLLYFHDVEKGSCTDYELCKVARHFKTIFLLSGNHRDIPTSIFQREGIISIDHGQILHSESLYQYSPELFEKRKGQVIK